MTNEIILSGSPPEPANRRHLTDAEVALVVASLRRATTDPQSHALALEIELSDRVTLYTF